MLLIATRRCATPDWMRTMEKREDNLRRRKPDRIADSDLFQSSFLVLSSNLGPQFVIKILLINCIHCKQVKRRSTTRKNKKLWKQRRLIIPHYVTSLRVVFTSSPDRKYCILTKGKM